MNRPPTPGITLKMNDGRTFLAERPNFVGLPAADAEQDIAATEHGGHYILDTERRQIVRVPPSGGKEDSEVARRMPKTKGSPVGE